MRDPVSEPTNCSTVSRADCGSQSKGGGLSACCSRKVTIRKVPAYANHLSWSRTSPDAETSRSTRYVATATASSCRAQMKTPEAKAIEAPLAHKAGGSETGTHCCAIAPMRSGYGSSRPMSMSPTMSRTAKTTRTRHREDLSRPSGNVSTTIAPPNRARPGTNFSLHAAASARGSEPGATRSPCIAYSAANACSHVNTTHIKKSKLSKAVGRRQTTIAQTHDMVISATVSTSVRTASDQPTSRPASVYPGAAWRSRIVSSSVATATSDPPIAIAAAAIAGARTEVG